MSYKREWGFPGFTSEWDKEQPSQPVLFLLITMSVAVWSTSLFMYLKSGGMDGTNVWSSELTAGAPSAAACPSSLQCTEGRSLSCLHRLLCSATHISVLSQRTAWQHLQSKIKRVWKCRIPSVCHYPHYPQPGWAQNSPATFPVNCLPQA